MHKRSRHDGAFTIIEILVVVAVIGLLMAILLPALAGAQKRAAKTREVSNLRQLSFAWNIYANGNNDAALPGYLEIDVQKPTDRQANQLGWNVTYKFPDDTDVPPSPNYNGAQNIAGPWTWRLLPHLEYNHEIVHGHLNEPDSSTFALQAEALEVANEPAFAYNGYYIGGWWTMKTFEDPNGDFTKPVTLYFDATDLAGKRVTVVASSVSQIRNPVNMITFCAGTRLSQGSYWDKGHQDNLAGWHIVNAPNRGNVAQWRTGDQGASVGGGPGVKLGTSTGDAKTVKALRSTTVPLGRYTGNVANLYADGHCDQQSPEALLDMRKWTIGARDVLTDDAINFMHFGFIGEE